MGITVVYQNDSFKIFNENNSLYIETFKKGISFNKLQEVLSEHPEIDIASFNTIKAAVNFAPKPAEIFGTLKPRIVIETFDNDLKATVVYNLPKEELDITNMEKIIRETKTKLNEKGIVFGIKTDLFSKDIISGKAYTIAEGLPPVHGKDAVISMYEIQEKTPSISDNGKVDFYELKLINRVKAGDWLGEIHHSTEGTPGKSVKGAVIKPEKGKDSILNYDRSCIREVVEGQKATLYSMIDGAVNYIDGKITVSNHLEIDGDIDFKTGNIKFDGYVTIKGTVSDGFIVEATRDIEISGALGLGNVKRIASTWGSILIKGGISSKGHSEIHAGKNVFTKFVDNAVIKSGGIVHIGFYCINSVIESKEVIIESSKGHIIGGSIKAEMKITVPVIGSEIEKKTVVEVSGFDREILKDEIDSSFKRISELRNEQARIKQALAGIDNPTRLDPFQRKEYNDNREKLSVLRDEIKSLEENRKTLAEYLKVRGEGEICITKKVYPNCLLILKSNVLEINSVTTPVTLFVQNGELKQA